MDPSKSRLLYAGDDENDAVAMRWVLRKGGIAICVGNRIRISGVRVVKGPVDLARAVRELAAIDPR
jgi:trehalose-6-phosphatase